MNFEEYQDKTSRTNIYSKSIKELLQPIYDDLWENAEKYHEQGYPYPPLERLNDVEELLNVCYVILGYTGEVAELSNKFKKVLRGDKDFSSFAKEAIDEIGDGYWYGVGQLPTLLGVNAAYIARKNLSKLEDRQERNVLRGDGDER